MLKVRILPKNNELHVAYLFRLADVNSFITIDELLIAMNLKKSKETYPVLINIYPNSPLFRALLEALNVTEGQLASQLTPHNMPFSVDEKRYVCRDITIKTPRICTDCVAEKQFIDHRGQLPLFSHCVKHNKPLISQCPSCEKPLKWSVNLFNGCQHCHVQWKSITSTQSNFESQLQIALWNEIIKPQEKTHIKIEDMLNVILAMGRPYDTYPVLRRTFPLCPELSTHISNAYKVIEDADCFQRWQQACIENRQAVTTVTQALTAPVTTLINTLKYFRFGELNSPQPVHFDLIESNSFIKHSLLKLTKSNNDTSLRYFMNRKQVELFLGLDGIDLIYAIKHKSLLSLNETRMPKDQVFHLGEVIDTLTNTLKDKSKTLINITECYQVMELHLCTRAMVIHALLMKELIGEINLSQNNAEIYIEISTFNKWLRRHFNALCEHNIHLLKAAKALQCSAGELKRYIDNKKLHYASWTGRRNEVTGESFKRVWTKRHRLSLTM